MPVHDKEMKAQDEPVAKRQCGDTSASCPHDLSDTDPVAPMLDRLMKRAADAEELRDAAWKDCRRIPGTWNEASREAYIAADDGWQLEDEFLDVLAVPYSTPLSTRPQSIK